MGELRDQRFDQRVAVDHLRGSDNKVLIWEHSEIMRSTLQQMTQGPTLALTISTLHRKTIRTLILLRQKSKRCNLSERATPNKEDQRDFVFGKVWFLPGKAWQWWVRDSRLGIGKGTFGQLLGSMERSTTTDIVQDGVYSRETPSRCGFVFWGTCCSLKTVSSRRG